MRDAFRVSLTWLTDPDVVRRTIVYENLPEGLRGVKILFASDVHMSLMMPERSVRHMIDTMRALNPDLILWGGDFAESRAWTERFFALAKSLNPPLGMVAAPGNNDYENYRGDMKALRRDAAGAGIRLLVNRADEISLAGSRLIIAGADDLEYGLPSGRMLRDQRDARSFCALIAHSPHALDSILRNVPHKPQLALCGHTHGGQIRLGALSAYSFAYDRRLVGDSEYFFVSGFRRIHSTDVLVSNGVGVSLLPLRIGAPPQIHLLTLSSG